MKKQKNNNGTTTYEIESQTGVGVELSEQIFDTMANSQVQPDEVLATLGEAVVRFLMMVAEPLGYEKKEIVKVFGEGLTNAEIEFEGN